MNRFAESISKLLNLKNWQVENTIILLNEGGTIPFISRYRKEKTGSLDEVQIGKIRDEFSRLSELEDRKEAILKSIDKQEKLTPELKKKIQNCDNLQELEDLYLPYKPKRKTKATVAKEKGLEDLAVIIYQQNSVDVNLEAEKFLSNEAGVNSIEEALQGARDIIAEWINENPVVRKKLRDLFINHSTISSRVIKSKEQEGEKYKDYFEFQSKLKGLPSHRLLALRRGEKEMILSINIAPDESDAFNIIRKEVIRSNNETTAQIETAVIDSYKRLLKPSLETEARLESKLSADKDAISVFTNNLRELLMASPLGQKSILAIDPGFRTGCKVVCLNNQGDLIENTTIFPNEPQKQHLESSKTVQHLVQKNRIEAIAIGNGTASRETEQFVKSLQLKDVPIIVVNESGASIYSASEIAREEFPDKDVTVRGAVSIGRRLMDPLAELVKIDPKSIGVGQYQHDVDQKSLKVGLDDTVMSCVNAVGVELNTSSAQLLSYVSGLGPQIAKNIVDYRTQNGPFRSRNQLLKVDRLGDKAYEQSAGFLRIKNAKHPLDSSAVHPERYALVDQIVNDLNVDLIDIIGSEEMVKKVNIDNYITDEIGKPTLLDILEELKKPSRDPRSSFDLFEFDDSVNEISDLKVGMKLPGIITNVTNFGAFVDVGVHQDGLVHISHLSDDFVKDPMAVVKVQQRVQVTVTGVEVERKRISLSMKADPFSEKQTPKRKSSKKPETKSVSNNSIDDLKRKFNRR